MVHKKQPFPDFVQANQLAEVWGIATEQIRRHSVEGHIPKGDRGWYPCSMTLLAFAQYQREVAKNARGAGATNDRIKSAKLREIELRIDEREKTLVPLEDALMLVDSIAGVLRAEMEGLAAGVTRDRELRYRIEERIDGSFNRAARRLKDHAAHIRSGGSALYNFAEDDTEPVGESQPHLSA